MIATAGKDGVAQALLSAHGFDATMIAGLSRDSLFAQQIAISFCVQVGDGTVDSGVEGVRIMPKP